MKKKIVLMSVAGVLAMTAVIGGTLAGFNTQSEQGKADITTKALSIDLKGTQAPIADEKVNVDVRIPGDWVDTPYFVTNDEENGYDLYTRVTIYKYWQDRENENLSAEEIHLYVGDDQENTELLTGEDGAVTHVGDWFIQYADEEQVILYYAKPLAPGETTQNVLDGLKIDARVGNEYTDQTVVLEVQADAVQKIAADASIPSEWGVYPTFDESGNITSITE